MATLSVQIIRKATRNVYDDTFNVYITTNNSRELTKSFKCNSQPAGSNPLPEGRGMVATGTWKYKPGTHGLSKPPSRRYAAFVQVRPIRVVRANGRGGWSNSEVADYSFNIHRGGYNGVSSLGCITFHPNVWESVKSFIYNKLDSFDQSTFDVTVINEGDEEKTTAQTTNNETTNNETTNNETTTQPNKFTYNLISPSGKITKITDARMVAGLGITKVRRAVAALTDLEPNQVVFGMTTVGGDFQISYNNVILEDADVEGEEGVTWCYIRDIITATQSSFSFDGDDKVVTIKAKKTT